LKSKAQGMLSSLKRKQQKTPTKSTKATKKKTVPTAKKK
jgi:hypothetical protein